MNIISSEKLKQMRYENEKANVAIKTSTMKRKSAQTNGKHMVSDNPRFELYNDLFTAGGIVEYPHGKVMQQGLKPFYYRGQIKDYGTSKSTLSRMLQGKDDETKKIATFVNQMRLEEFNELICQLEQVKNWRFGDVFTYAIAQHYGFASDIIDITDDLDVALFFASCKHIANNQYRPLSKEDIKDNRYGMLFIRNQNKDLIDPNNLKVFPIGFQPFTRCHNQRGYFVHANNDKDLQTNKDFEKYYFEHSIDLSEEIFNKFNKGADLFKYDALVELKDLMEDIQSATTFSMKSFETVYNMNKESYNQEEWIQLLELKCGIQIGKNSYKLTRQRKRHINRKWSVERFLKEEKVAPGYRMVRHN